MEPSAKRQLWEPLVNLETYIIRAKYFNLFFFATTRPCQLVGFAWKRSTWLLWTFQQFLIIYLIVSCHSACKLRRRVSAIVCHYFATLAIAAWASFLISPSELPNINRCDPAGIQGLRWVTSGLNRERTLHHPTFVSWYSSVSSNRIFLPSTLIWTSAAVEVILDVLPTMYHIRRCMKWVDSTNLS